MTKSKKFATAIHIMTLLAFNERLKLKPSLSSEHIADSLQANPTLVRRVLSVLSKSQLVSSQKGKSGGARLGKKREKINLREIYESVEPGEILKLSDREQRKDCPVSCQINEVLEDIFDDAEISLLEYLEKVKLKELVDQIIDRYES